MTDEVLRGAIWPLGLQATKIFVWSEGFDELSVCKKKHSVYQSVSCGKLPEHGLSRRLSLGFHYGHVPDFLVSR